MSKTLIGVLVGVVVVAGGAYFFLHNNKLEEKMEPAEEGMQNPALNGSGTSAPLETINPNAKKNNNTTSGTSSMFNPTNDPTTCTFNSKNMTSTDVGTSYQANGKFYFSIKNTDLKNNTVTSYGLVLGNNLYNWTSKSDTGSKVYFKEVTDSTFVNLFNSRVNVSDNKGSFKCDPWTLDPNKFSIPSNIKFLDLTSVSIPKF